MRHLFTFLITITILSSCGQDLVILHTNDTHSQMESIALGDKKGKGGIVKRAEYFEKVRAENRNVLILDAGDYNQGTPYFTVFKGDMEIDVMNALGYDVVALGNHEFDNGQDELARRLKNAEFPTVCANYDFEDSPLGDLVEPYVIIEKAGKKIGIIGLTLNLRNMVSHSAIEGLEYENPITKTNEYAKILKYEKKCDLVIVLSHLGYDAYNPDYDTDIKLAKKSENVDIIIGGHSHTFLDEETIVDNIHGEKVIVVQAGDRGEGVGRLDLKF